MIMDSFAKLISTLDGWLWGLPLIILLFGTHLFLTVRLKFIQRYIFKGIRLSVKKDEYGSGDVSQFGALATALAATIGTGNIVGVATAVGLGGPGAVLWCWLTGVFGIATKYAESLLSVKYRVKTKDGTMAGGPMYVLEYGLKSKWAGVVFAIFTSVAAFGIGCMVQANSVAATVQTSMQIPTWITGLVIAALTAAVILGGLKSIAKVCNILVPFMAIFYVIGCIILLVLGYKTLGDTAALILRWAFTPQAAVGGFAGAAVMMAMRYGIARGLFSNESGLGSAPIVAAAAQTRNPVKQALVSATGTFWDTVIVCAMTGLVLVNSGLWKEGLKGAQLSTGAFAAIPVVGPIILTIGLITFVFSTILGWSYYGEKAIEYLLGKKAILPYRILWIVLVFLGSVFSLSLVWDLADLFNGLMAIPNLISLLLLSPVLVSETKKYLWSGNLEEIDKTPIQTIERK
jgi:AGCS family alanine or glycine:cation symporter